jgi:hypothetical protein
MNFYKDPLIERLRLIESRILSEALSDDEFVELQRLRAELADDPEASKLHSDVDAVVTARARDLEKPSVTTDPNKPPVDPNKKKPGYKINPGTRAYQNWLNSQGVTVGIDGKLGPETQGAGQKLIALNKEFGSGGKRSNEFSDMQGVGTAVNVRPQKTDDGKMMWIGSQGYLAAMQKYGYDPKTGDPIGGAKKPPDIAAHPAPSNTMTRAGTPPELAKVDPSVNNEYWVNGTRYKFTGIGNNGTWAPNFQSTDIIGSPANRKLSREKYTGPVPGAGTQPSKPAADYDSSTYESINRIKHLSGL